MIKLKDLLKETTVAMGQVHSNPYASSFKSSEQIEEEQLDERIKTPFMVHPTDPDQTERHWVKVFKELAKGHGAVMHYGPRESDMYDWNDRSNYRDAITEYNKYMDKLADKLNKSLDDMNNIYKVWDKISKKYRKKDGGR
jgi:hypothetical protein